MKLSATGAYSGHMPVTELALFCVQSRVAYSQRSKEPADIAALDATSPATASDRGVTTGLLGTPACSSGFSCSQPGSRPSVLPGWLGPVPILSSAWKSCRRRAASCPSPSARWPLRAPLFAIRAGNCGGHQLSRKAAPTRASQVYLCEMGTLKNSRGWESKRRRRAYVE